MLVMRIAILLLLLLAGSVQADKIDVWFDVDPANGVGEIDDGLMLIQAFHSPELHVRGVSVVFGNAPLRYATNAAHNVVKLFGPAGMTVHVGAESGDDFGKENDAVRAMANALRDRPMTIAAVGPVTNVGTLVKLHPELHERIERIIVVAGRRPGQRFITTEKSKALPPRDFNFECDVPAMQAILDSSIEFVMAPWEVSSKVWVTREDVESLKQSGPSGQYIHMTSQHWIDGWESRRGIAAFNPYDTLAVGWLTHPPLVQGDWMDVRIEQGPDERDESKTKSYLHVRASAAPQRRGLYLHTPAEALKPMLLSRLAAPATADVDHADFDALLKKHVDELGMVNYAALKADSSGLDAYLKQLADVDLKSLSPDAELALLINAYNACTLKLIAEHHSPAFKSIKDIAAEQRWKAVRWNIGGNVWSLDDIEHGQIRQRFNEPRIHWALVCAARSCPPLRREAYTAQRLQEQLEDQSRRVHSDAMWLSYDPKANVLRLTRLYEWYGKDFDKVGSSVLQNVARYVPIKGQPRIEWIEYDWALNSQ